MLNNLLNLYQQRLNLQNSDFLPIEHKEALVAIVHKVLLPSGREYILKICTRPSDYHCELYFLNYFTDILSVPRIIDVVEPGGEINGAILMEYLPGALLSASSITNDLAYEIGVLLAKIHSNQVPGYGDLTQPKTLSREPNFYFTLKFEEGLNECRGHLPEKLLEQCQDYYHAQAYLLNSVDGPCMTHRDFRAGNIIVHGGKIQGVIDWASARASFAEEDFCHLAFEELFTKNTYKQSFLTGYASIRPVPDYERLLSLLSFCRAIAIIGFTIKSGTWKNKNAALYQQSRKIMHKLLIAN